MATLEIIHDPAQLVRSADHWPEASQADGGAALGTSLLWLRSWYEAFSAEGEPEVWSFSDGAAWLGAIPLVRRTEPNPWRIPPGLQVLAGAANVHTPDYGIIGPQPGQVLDSLCRELTAQRGRWDQIILPRVPAASALATEGPRALARHGLSGLRIPTAFQAKIPTGQGEDAWAAARRSLVRKTGQYRRGLERQGELRFDVVRDLAEFDAAFEQFTALEAAGWKGARGSAISSSEVTRRFYWTLSRRAAETHSLRLGLLRLDGKLIAASLALAAGGTVYWLKSAFDEAYSRWSPGNVEHLEALRCWFADPGIREIDMGATLPGDTKERWVDERRPVYAVYVFGRRLASQAIRLDLAVRARLKRSALGQALEARRAKRRGSGRNL